MNHTPAAQHKDDTDIKRVEHGRSRHLGFRKGTHSYVQPSPMFFTADGHPLWIGDTYRGRSAFLIAGGPSFGALDHAKLRKPGILTLGLNNSPRTFRPNMWVSVDSPDHWIRSIWLDPTIQKFVPLSHSEKKIFNSDKWEFNGHSVGDCPNVVYYKRNERFTAKQFLWEDCFNWGNHKKYGGGRSVLLPAIRILFLLGIRTVYLLGVDFNMSESAKYHFDQDRHKGSIGGNRDTYQKLNGWFTELRPLFEKEGFNVFNCNPESGLKAFRTISFEDALAHSADEFDNVDTANERTRGLYDTETREKEEKVGGRLTWFRIHRAKGLNKCKYCGKGCGKISGDTEKPGLITIRVGCEQSRRALWKSEGAKLTGDNLKVETGYKPEAEAVADWNSRFGKARPPEQAEKGKV